MAQYPFHKMLGWAGTVIALLDYGAFAAGIILEFWFFLLGIGASLLLAYALFRDRTFYAGVLQTAFIFLNVIGMVRVMWG